MALDYDPKIRNPEIEKLLIDIGRIIRSAMPKGYGFALEIFAFGDSPEFFYISNSQREDMVKALEEFCADQRRRQSAGLP